jgi:hypothetical protein
MDESFPLIQSSKLAGGPMPKASKIGLGLVKIPNPRSLPGLCLFCLSGKYFCFSRWKICEQRCGNTEIFYLSPRKLSEKSYLSGQNPTCPVFFINIWYLQTQLLTKLNLFILSFTSLRKIWNIVLRKLTQTSLPKWSLPKWRPF